jgi:hypothetical protein
MQSKIDFRRAIRKGMARNNLTGHALDRHAGVTRGTTTAYLRGRDAGCDIAGKLLSAAGVRVIPGGDPQHMQALIVRLAVKHAGGDSPTAAAPVLGISRPFASLFLRGERACKSSRAERMLQRLGCKLVG